MTAIRYRELDIKAFAAVVGDDLDDAGPLPELKWLDIADLVVDPRYQREVGRAGEKNVVAIARNFKWRKFGIIVVAPTGDGRYAIVDGQHRTLGAGARRMGKVPCMIIQADPKEQADTFSAINGNVTLMTPLQIHAAKVVAGDEEAVALDAACRAGGVTICRYPVPGNKMERGETLAISALSKLHKTYGAATLSLALSCITRTGDGNPGCVRAAIVKALVNVLDAEPSWRRSPDALIAAMGDFKFERELDAATVAARARKLRVDVVYGQRIFEHLAKRMARAA